MKPDLRQSWGGVTDAVAAHVARYEPVQRTMTRDIIMAALEDDDLMEWVAIHLQACADYNGEDQ